MESYRVFSKVSFSFGSVPLPLLGEWFVSTVGGTRFSRSSPKVISILRYLCS